MLPGVECRTIDIKVRELKDDEKRNRSFDLIYDLTENDFEFRIAEANFATQSFATGCRRVGARPGGHFELPAGAPREGPPDLSRCANVALR